MNLLEEEAYYKSISEKIFCSHSSKDERIVEAFVEMLLRIGLKHNNIFCSSDFDCGIPLGEKIYDFLRKEFLENKLYVLFFLSPNYYNSVACLNEMGAAWVLRSEYLSVILPGFKFSQIEGAVDPSSIALDLNGNYVSRLNELKEKLEDIFHIPEEEQLTLSRWEKYREEFRLEVERYRKELD